MYGTRSKLEGVEVIENSDSFRASFSREDLGHS